MVSRLDTMVTVVDAANFLHEYNAADALQDRGESLGEDDNRTVTDLLIDQIEFADVIVLNKLDLVSETQGLEIGHHQSAQPRGCDTKSHPRPGTTGFGPQHGSIRLRQSVDLGRLDPGT